MSKDFKQQLQDLQSGLVQIYKIIRESKKRSDYQRAFRNKDIQEARIEFFKIGYNLAKKELKEQTKLGDENYIAEVKGAVGG